METAYQEALTEREREIAELAAIGYCNGEIAGKLFVSIRTVEGHLYRSFHKLGISRRRELAAALGVTLSVTPERGVQLQSDGGRRRMGKLERELVAALDDLARHFNADGRDVNESAMDTLSTANRVHGVVAALTAVEEVIRDGYVYYGTDSDLRPATHWLRLEGGAWMATTEREQHMPWDEYQPITSLPHGGLVYRNRFGAMVDPRGRRGHCEDCGLNPESEWFKDGECPSTAGGEHLLRLKEGGNGSGGTD